MRSAKPSTVEKKKLTSLRTALAATTRCTQAVMQATSETLLMEQVCSIIVDEGYRFCWVGAAEQNDEKSVRPLAWAGHEHGYLSSIKITWSNSKYGRGPAGRAIRSAKPVVFQDLAGNPDYHPWQAEAIQRGYRSSSALPLMTHGITFGLLSIYAGEPGVFGAAEMESLTNLAEILSFGITNLRERQQTELALREISELNQQVISDAHEGIIVFDHDLRCQLWNPYMEELTGISAQEVVGKLPFEKFPFLRTLGVEEELKKALAGFANVTNDLPFKRPQSERTMWVSGRHTPLRDRFGQVTKVLAAVRDVTERKEVYEALRQSEERLQQAARVSQIGIFEHDHITDAIYWSPEMRKIFGFDPDEEVTLPVYLDHVYAEDREAIAVAIQRAHDPASGGFFDVENRIVRRDGNLRWIFTRAQTFFKGEGTARHKVRTVGAVLDITERKQAESALRESDATLQSLFLSAPVGLTIHRGRILCSVNDHFCAIAGRSRETLIGCDTRQFYQNDEEFDRVGRALYETLWETGLSNVETRFVRPDGSVREVALFAAPLQPNDRSAGAAVAVQDISERKRAEQALREAEEKYHGIFESAVVGIFQSDLSGRFLSVNPAMARMLGYSSPQELITSITDIAQQFYVDLKSRKAFRRLVEQQGVVQNFECQVYRKDSSKIWISISARAVRENGVVIGYEGMNLDITERKLLEEELIQVQKMEAVGRLAGGMAHDFHNILGVIIGYADLSLGRLAPDDAVKTYQAQIRKAADRAVSLTQQLLAFSRRQIVFPKPLDLNAVVHNLTSMLLRLVREDIAISFRPTTPIDSIIADQGQIEQIMMNLVVNARDAMPSGGQITIETGHAELDEHFVFHNPGSRTGQYVVLTVSDTGCGMDENVKSQIFEPFFTTKEVGLGTGLGLSTVYGIVKQSGGYIWVGSEPGKGTSFKVYFPRVAEKPEEPAPSHGEAEIRKGSETILVVEDDEALRELAIHLLQSAGYRVIEAATAEIALDILRAKPGIDLLLTDVIMPGKTGVELLEQAKALYPNLRSVFMSGYPGDLVALRGGLMPEAAFLEKPFTQISLLTKVYSALHNKSAKH